MLILEKVYCTNYRRFEKHGYCENNINIWEFQKVLPSILRVIIGDHFLAKTFMTSALWLLRKVNWGHKIVDFLYFRSFYIAVNFLSLIETVSEYFDSKNRVLPNSSWVKKRTCKSHQKNLHFFLMICLPLF